MRVADVLGPLDVDDPDVQRVMAVVEKFSAEERAEVIRTVYRYVLAYRRQPDTDLLKMLVNSLVHSVQLWEDEGYRRATEAAQKTRETRPVAYEDAIDVREVFGSKD